MELAAILVKSWHDQRLISLAVAVTALAVAWSTGRAIYRLFFHPLRHFPGPKLRAISDFPQALAGTRGRQHFAIRDLHERYGQVVRLGPNLLSFITPTAWKDIHGHAAAKRFDKYGYFEVRPDAQPVLTAAGEDHVRQRAALAHGFSEKAILAQETSVTRHVALFVDKLRAYASTGKAADMTTWTRYLAFDVIGDFTLSMHFGCVASSQNHPWVDLLARWFKAVGYADNAMQFGFLSPLLMLFADFKALGGIKTHLDISAEKLRDRISVGDDPHKSDLWTYVMRNKGDKSLTLPEMEVNAGFILSAATEPISDTLCAAIYLLGRHRPQLRKLYAELNSRFKSDEAITMSAVAGLPFLHGVIEESMRLFTPAPAGARRKVPRGGGTVSGYHVPEGTVVCVYQLPAFTLAYNWAHSDRFVPERWLRADDPDRPPETLADKQDAFQPFGYGPKNCIGKGLAYAEMKLIIAKFVWHFDFELLDDSFAVEKQKIFLFRDRPPLNVKLVERLH